MRLSLSGRPIGGGVSATAAKRVLRRSWIRVRFHMDTVVR